METGTDIWTYRDQAVSSLDLVGYSVEATDGSIGKIDEATNEVGGSYIVVDTGPWIFGKHVLLPAGVIDNVDQEDKKVYVNRTKEEIKNAPEYDSDRGIDDTYRTEVGGYYSSRS
jgi:PRC-barrel domain protein